MKGATSGLQGLRSVSATLRGSEELMTLSAMMIVVMVGFGMISPVLPLFGQSFGVSSAMVGLLVTAFGLARLFANLPAGRLADRVGRRPLIVAAPLITAAGAIFAAVAPGFWLLVAARFVQGIGSAVFATAAMTALADISTPATRGRMMTIFQGSLLLGTSFGPSIGGLIADALGLRGVFWVYAAFSVAASGWAFARIKETRQAGHASRRERGATEPASERGGALALLLDPSFLAISLVSFAIFFTRTGSRSTIIPLLAADRLGLTESAIGLLLTVAAVCNVLTLPLAGWGIDRFGRKTVIVPSLLVSAGGLLLFTVPPTVAIFMLGSAVLGIGTGIAGPAPAAYAADLGRHGNYGVTMGLFRTMSDFGFVVGPVLLGWLSDRDGYGFALEVNVVLLFAAAAGFALIARETRPSADVVVARTPSSD